MNTKNPLHIPTDNAPSLEDECKAAGVIKSNAKRGSSVSGRQRVFLDHKSAERITMLVDYIKRDLGKTCSRSMAIRLCIHNVTGRLAEALGAGDALAKRIKNAAEGR